MRSAYRNQGRFFDRRAQHSSIMMKREVHKYVSLNDHKKAQTILARVIPHPQNHPQIRSQNHHKITHIRSL